MIDIRPSFHPDASKYIGTESRDSRSPRGSRCPMGGPIGHAGGTRLARTPLNGAIRTRVSLVAPSVAIRHPTPDDPHRKGGTPQGSGPRVLLGPAARAKHRLQAQVGGRFRLPLRRTEGLPPMGAMLQQEDPGAHQVTA